MKARRLSLVAIGAIVIGEPALAAAPEPAKPVATDLYSGRWYEIARTPNPRQADCQGDTVDFSGWTAGAFSAVQTCHKGALNGPTKDYKAHGSILPGSGNAKMKLSFFGGLISQSYWIIDHADDNEWAIMATPAGHYIWLLSRRPSLDASARSTALGRIQALGFDRAQLIFNAKMPG